MKKLSTIVVILIAAAFPMIWGSTGLSQTDNPDTAAVDDFEQAVEIIKKYETIHKPKHWPFVGYGHRVLPGEKFSRRKTLSESEADALLRKDLKKNCAVFREFGKDSLLLGVLAYNIGMGATSRSSIVKKLRAGDRDIRESYINHCRYRGKVHKGIRNRRTEEFDTLFDDLKNAEKKVDTSARKLLTNIINPFKLIIPEKL